jgi:hypothetical protein
MAKSISDIQKKVRLGRPPNPEGRFTPILFRFPPTLIEAIDAYARSRELGRSEAVRQLIEVGLKTKRMPAK